MTTKDRDILASAIRAGIEANPRDRPALNRLAERVGNALYADSAGRFDRTCFKLACKPPPKEKG
jgi:hypothetical protein